MSDWKLKASFSKVFDKVWHKDFLFKLSLNAISGNLLDLLTSF